MDELVGAHDVEVGNIIVEVCHRAHRRRYHPQRADHKAERHDSFRCPHGLLPL